MAEAALTRAQRVFAVRSGGHTNWAGSKNIDDGVTMNLGLRRWGLPAGWRARLSFKRPGTLLVR